MLVNWLKKYSAMAIGHDDVDGRAVGAGTSGIGSAGTPVGIGVCGGDGGERVYCGAGVVIGAWVADGVAVVDGVPVTAGFSSPPVQAANSKTANANMQKVWNILIIYTPHLTTNT